MLGGPAKPAAPNVAASECGLFVPQQCSLYSGPGTVKRIPSVRKYKDTFGINMDNKTILIFTDKRYSFVCGLSNEGRGTTSIGNMHFTYCLRLSIAQGDRPSVL